LFAIDPETGALRFRTAPNFEAAPGQRTVPGYQVVVRATNGSESDQQAITVTLLDVNEAPTGRDRSYTINEDGSFTFNPRGDSSDPETARDLLEIVVGAPANGVVTRLDDGRYRYTPNANYAGGDSFTYTVSDGVNTTTQTISVTVNERNDRPVIESNGGQTLRLTVPENSTDALTRIVASDADGDTLRFRLSGDDAERFTIDDMGVLRFAQTPDFEAPADLDGDNRYRIVVEVDDGRGGVDRQSVLVQVSDLADQALIAGTDGPDLALRGTNSADVFDAGAGADRVAGLNGNDRFIVRAGDGNDRYDGGGGTDTVDFSGLTASVMVNLAARLAQVWNDGTDTLISIENIIGGAGGDMLVGSSAANRLEGGLGDDSLTGGAGADTFVIGAGLGNDTIQDFERGVDALQFEGDPGVWSITGATIFYEGGSLTLAGLSEEEAAQVWSELFAG